MAVATLDDVAERLGRTPLPDEATALTARLEDAEAAIMVRIPSLLTQVGLDLVFAANVIGVECDIALRAAGISHRIDTVTPAPGTIVEMQDGRPGFVSVRTEEWRKLGLSEFSVLNPYPNPFEDFLTLDPNALGMNAGWSNVDTDDCTFNDEHWT
jgi:hypothetical protein